MIGKYHKHWMTCTYLQHDEFYIKSDGVFSASYKPYLYFTEYSNLYNVRAKNS